MASLKDVEKLTDDLGGLVDELRSEIGNGRVDFERLIQIADQISERADGFAGTFASVNDALMSRLNDVLGGGSRSSQSSSSSSTESKATSGSKS